MLEINDSMLETNDSMLETNDSMLGINDSMLETNDSMLVSCLSLDKYRIMAVMKIKTDIIASISESNRILFS